MLSGARIGSIQILKKFKIYDFNLTSLRESPLRIDEYDQV